MDASDRDHKVRIIERLTFLDSKLDLDSATAPMALDSTESVATLSRLMEEFERSNVDNKMLDLVCKELTIKILKKIIIKFNESLFTRD